MKFVGKHTLNYEPVWVVMDFDLATLEGKAHLEKRDITLDPTEAEKEAILLPISADHLLRE